MKTFTKWYVQFIESYNGYMSQILRRRRHGDMEKKEQGMGVGGWGLDG